MFDLDGFSEATADIQRAERPTANMLECHFVLCVAFFTFDKMQSFNNDDQ